MHTAVEGILASNLAVYTGGFAPWVAWTFFIAVIAIICYGLGMVLYDSNQIQRFLKLSFVFGFVDGLNYASMLPDATGSAALAGGDAVFSGWLISTFRTGTFLGILALYLFIIQDPNQYVQIWAKTIYTANAVLMCISTVLFVAVILSCHSSTLSFTAAQILLITARFISGAAGSYQFIATICITIYSSPVDIVGNFVSFSFARMLGSGCGPILCAIAHFMLEGVVQPFLETPVTMMPIQFFLLMTILICMKMPMVDIEAVIAQQNGAGLREERHGHRVAFICVGLMFVAVRGFIVSGVEAGSSMILDIEYLWSIVQVGLAIGITYLVCLPLMAVQTFVKNRQLLTEWGIFRGLMILTAVGAVCFQPFLCSFAPCPFIILIGDALVFPCFYFASEIVSGIYMRQVFTKGVFGRETVILLRYFFVDGIGRTIGPPLARSTLIDEGRYQGREVYATMQVVVILASWVVIELAYHVTRSWISEKAIAVDKQRPDMLPLHSTRESPDDTDACSDYGTLSVARDLKDK